MYKQCTKKRVSVVSFTESQVISHTATVNISPENTIYRKLLTADFSHKAKDKLL